MYIDQKNPVVKLCITGLQLIAQGKEKEAHLCFTEAWDSRKNDLDACIAAHFIAKHKKSLDETLTWNLKALKYADKVEDDFVKDFYPSLYINIADSYERLGKKKTANRYYTLAASTVTNTSLGSHGILLLESIKNGQQRTS